MRAQSLYLHPDHGLQNYEEAQDSEGGHFCHTQRVWMLALQDVGLDFYKSHPG